MPSVDPAELEGKANLLTDMQLGAVTVKKKRKTRSVQACSLFSLSSLSSGKGKKKASFLFFLPLYCNSITLSSLFLKMGNYSRDWFSSLDNSWHSSSSVLLLAVFAIRTSLKEPKVKTPKKSLRNAGQNPQLTLHGFIQLKFKFKLILVNFFQALINIL